MRTGLIHEDQRGISLIEMVTVLALIGLLGAAIVMTLTQVLTVSSRASDGMIAVRQVQQAGDRVSKDVLQAGVVTPDEYSPSGFPLRLTIAHFDDESGGFEEYTVIFRLHGDRLQREYYADYVDEASQPDYINTVAQHIVEYDPDDPLKLRTSFVPGGEAGAYVFRVTAKVGTRIEDREYEIKRRPTG